MKLCNTSIILLVVFFTSSVVHAFTPIRLASCRCTSAAVPSQPTPSSRTTPTALNIVVGDERNILDKVQDVFKNTPEPNEAFDNIVQKHFPGAIPNKDLVLGVVDALDEKGYTTSNTLLATSLCCDELARQLEDDFNGIYGNNFNLGGLAGFPFAGVTGFGAMSAHIPDDGYCLIVYGPHVGITADGIVGKVERVGIELQDTCCHSAILANNFVQKITDGGAEVTTKLQQFSDRQQDAVRKLVLPHGKRLSDAEDRMVELPFTLFESQDLLMKEIVKRSTSALEGKKGLALLGGIQINTGPNTPDYFLPSRFVYIDFSDGGDGVDDMLPGLLKKRTKI